MGYKDLSHLGHDRDLAFALGEMVVAWAKAETSLCAVLARVTGMNINMAIMGYYRIPTFEARRKFIQSLMLEWKTKKYDKRAIAKQVDGLSDLSLARNDWIHGVWCASDDMSETVIFDFRRAEDRGRRKPVKAADVKNHVLAVIDRSLELDKLVDRDSMSGV